jgi:hypothetical protein
MKSDEIPSVERDHRAIDIRRERQNLLVRHAPSAASALRGRKNVMPTGS